MYNNFGGLDHLKAIRGRFRKLEAVFESFFDYNVWGIKRCGIKNIQQMYNNFAVWTI